MGLIQREVGSVVIECSAGGLLPGAAPQSLGDMVAAARASQAGRRRRSRWAARIKRAGDVILACLLLVLVAAPMLMIALAVRLETPGPALFRQRRTGLEARPFTILKFRTMRDDLADPQARTQTAPRDGRVTAVGALLRRTSLDELPQLLNVLRGDMALVGPRPHAAGMMADGLTLDEAVPGYADRHRIRPGLTGLAQVRGQRGAADTRDLLAARLASDLEYLETWSLLGDAAILLRTAVVVARMENAW